MVRGIDTISTRIHSLSSAHDCSTCLAPGLASISLFDSVSWAGEQSRTVGVCPDLSVTPRYDFFLAIATVMMGRGDGLWNWKGYPLARKPLIEGFNDQDMMMMASMGIVNGCMFGWNEGTERDGMETRRLLTTIYD